MIVSKVSLPLGILLLVSSVGLAEGATELLLSGCPANPSRCTYASAEVRVGPLLVTIEAHADNGSAELESNVTIARGESGTIVIGVSANSSAQNETFNVSFQVNDTEGLTWGGAQNASFAYTPTPGFSETREFRFTVDDDASGELPVPIVLGVDDATGFTYVTFLVLQESVEGNDTPIPALPLALAVVAAVALARRKEH